MNNKTCYEKLSLINADCGKASCQFFCKTMNKNCSIVECNNNKGFLTLQQITELMNLSRARICQIEESATKKLSTNLSALGFDNIPLTSGIDVIVTA